MPQIISLVTRSDYRRAAHEVASENVDKSHFVTDDPVLAAAKCREGLAETELFVIDEKSITPFLHALFGPMHRKVKSVPTLIIYGKLDSIKKTLATDVIPGSIRARFNIAGIFQREDELNQRIAVAYQSFFSVSAQKSFSLSASSGERNAARKRLRTLLADAAVTPIEDGGLFLRKLMDRQDALFAENKFG